jgi:hypothetical protein
MSLDFRGFLEADPRRIIWMLKRIRQLEEEGDESRERWLSDSVR